MMRRILIGCTLLVSVACEADRHDQARKFWVCEQWEQDLAACRTKGGVPITERVLCQGFTLRLIDCAFPCEGFIGR